MLKNMLLHIMKHLLEVVETLCLNVENGVGIKDNTLASLNELCKSYLVLTLDLLKSLKNSGVILVLKELLQLFGLVSVIGADALVKESTETGVGVDQPTTVGNTVGNVSELGGVLHAEVVENVLLQNIGVQS